MFKSLISRLDNWALSFEGTIVETGLVWYDGTPVYVYIPYRPFFIIKWFKDFWAKGAADRQLATWAAEGFDCYAIPAPTPEEITDAN